MNTLTRIALLGDVASIRQGHPFRGAIAAVPEGPVQVIQLKNLALDGLQERDHLLRGSAGSFNGHITRPSAPQSRA